MAKPIRQTTKTNTYGAMSTATKSRPKTPSEEQIRARAYQIYVRRKGGPGDAASDWKQAERELRQELST